MPKVLHSTVYEYKNRINDLEYEVSTLKKRLDELRKAKNQTYIKRDKPVRRLSKSLPDGSQSLVSNASDDSDVVTGGDTDALTHKLTKLQIELELAELRYTRDTTTLNNTITRLQEEMNEMRESHKLELEQIHYSHYRVLETLKRDHTEELAIYSDTGEKDCVMRQAAQDELAAYKQKMRSISIPDIELLKSDLARLRKAYASLQVKYEAEVQGLEERIANLLAEIANRNDYSKRRFQLIPERTYIVRKTSPSSSQSSIGGTSKSLLSNSISSKPTIKHTHSLPVKHSNYNQYDHSARPKSCVERPTTNSNINCQSTSVSSRPKTCYEDKRPAVEKKQTRPKTAVSCYKNKYIDVSSRIDSGRAKNSSELSESLLKYRTTIRPINVRGSWRPGARSFGAKMNYF